MPDNLAEIRHEIALANRMLANEGVLDAFGHVSMRHPSDPKRYLLSRSRSPELVEPSDILEFDLDSQPCVPPTARLYGERVIHGEIYKARPDVKAVVHHHAPAIMPYAIAGTDIIPVFHLGATMGGTSLPFWDQRDDFGDSNLLVIKPEEGASLARALGPHWMVLMRNHGATVAGRSLREVVFRSIYSCDNAKYLTQAKLLGSPRSLNAYETKAAGDYNLAEGPVARAWEYWTIRLQKNGELPPRTAATKAASARKPAKPAARRTKAKTSKAKTSRGKTTGRTKR